MDFQDIYLAVSTIIEECIKRGLLERKNEYSIEEIIVASKKLEEDKEHEQILRSKNNS